VPDIVIRTHGLTREFSTLRAVDSLSIQVPAGTIFGFLGPNGSGKTTTIRMLLGLLEPTAGRAEVLGYDTRTQADEIRLRCGALLEHPGLYERFSAWDNLEFYARIWRLSRRERRARIEELLRGVGLWERRQESVGRWSRGISRGWPSSVPLRPLAATAQPGTITRHYDEGMAPQKDGGLGLRVGSKMRHPKFGIGEVKAWQSVGDDWKVTIRFASVGVKTVMAKFLQRP